MSKRERRDPTEPFTKEECKYYRDIEKKAKAMLKARPLGYDIKQIDTKALEDSEPLLKSALDSGTLFPEVMKITLNTYFHVKMELNQRKLETSLRNQGWPEHLIDIYR